MMAICKNLNSVTQMVAWFKCYTTRASLKHYGGNCLEVSKAIQMIKNYKLVEEVKTVGLFFKKA